MKGNMSYTLGLSYESIDTIKALKRFKGINAKKLIEEALQAYMDKNKIEISIDEETVWIWSMQRPDAGFMSRADEKWHDATHEWEDDFTLESDQFF